MRASLCKKIATTFAAAALATTLVLAGCSSSSSKPEPGMYGTMPEGHDMTTGGDIAPDFAGSIGSTGPKQ